MKYIMILLVFLLPFSCKNGAETAAGNMNAYGVSDTVFLDSRGNRYQYIGLIPDSLRTPEQQALIRKLGEVAVKYIAIKDNHMVIEITKEQFLAKGIPERYYRILQKNVRDNNAFIDSVGIKDVDELIKERNDRYYRLLQKQKKP